MSTKQVPLPGDFGLSRISGFVGAMVHVGQAINRDKSYWTHAFVVLDEGQFIQAVPGGAEILPLSELGGQRVKYSDFPLSKSTRAQIVEEARALEGTPYSFLDYAALSFERFNVGFGLTRKYVKNTGHMICSQLVDEAYRRAGVHLFDDGRLPQDVTPGDLARLID